MLGSAIKPSAGGGESDRPLAVRCCVSAEKNFSGMTRLNLILFFSLILSGLGLVSSQHKARKPLFELEKQHQAEKQYEQEYGQLQLEQSTWRCTRIDKSLRNSCKCKCQKRHVCKWVTLDAKLEALPIVEKAVP